MTLNDAIDFETFHDIEVTVSEIAKEKSRLVAQLSSLKKDVAEKKEYLESAKETQVILNEVAYETQSEVENHLSSVVTMALSAVEVDDESVPKPPKFVARMVERRGTTECDLLFKEGQREQHPLSSSGFGYCDIADYALRIDYILLESEYGNKDVRKTLISDEPFRNVDPKLQHKVAEMLEMISKELGFQQVVVSHAVGVNMNADTIFHVTKNGKISSVSNPG